MPFTGQQHDDDGAGLVARRRHPGPAEGRRTRRIRTKSVETEATTTVANAWETLTFDFANQAAGTAGAEPGLHLQQGRRSSSTSA
ncbi:MAG: hypothetical protein M0C28_34540 [Candidatus Moduliflexus flocculans]|nr:hypothetical protein [Candidatus Moduliflexus flocculans]